MYRQIYIMVFSKWRLSSQTLLVCDFHVILSDLFHKNTQNPVLDSYSVKKYYEIRDNY